MVTWYHPFSHKEPHTDRRGGRSDDGHSQEIPDIHLHGFVFGSGEVIKPTTGEGRAREEVDGTVVRTVRQQ